MYETVKVIRLSDMDEVKDFVRAAGGCDFDIDVICSGIIQLLYRDYGTLSPAPYSGAGLFIVK